MKLPKLTRGIKGPPIRKANGSFVDSGALVTMEPIRTPSISHEMGRMAMGGFFNLVLFSAAVASANPIIPMRVGQTPTVEPPALVAPQHFRLVPLVESVAASNPVPGFLYGRTVPSVPDAIVQPFVGRVAQVPIVQTISFRYGQSLVFDSANPVQPSVGRVHTAPFVAPASPVISFRYGALVDLQTQASANQSGFTKFPFYSFTVAPANPVIQFVYGQILSRIEEATVQPYFIRVNYASAAGPVGPMQAGTVPVRYVIGETANVVPVITVAVWEIGVVPVREFVGPAHVVPVREVTTEVPHVKVIKS